MANPVQVVLNTRDFFVSPDPGRMGPPKDFFADKDIEFVQHRDRLRKQVAAVSTGFKQSSVSTGIIKVTLRKEAWAKSYRPERTLFPPKRRPCVGAAKLGELFYMVSEDELRDLDLQISSAEDKTRWRTNKKLKQFTSPTVQRSEVGAVESISVPSASDKRRFTAEQALAWFSDPRTSSAYLVELFGLPRTTPSVRLLSHHSAIIREIQSHAFNAGLSLDIYPITATENNRTSRSSGIFGMRLLENVDGSDSQSNRNITEHQQLLNFLDHYPYVKRVMLPPIIMKSASTSLSSGSIPPELPTRIPGLKYPKIGIIDGGLSAALGNWIIGRHDLVAPEHCDVSHGTFIGGLLVVGQQVNGPSICPEADGCELVDVAIFPDNNQPVFDTYYPRGISDFIKEISQAVGIAKRDHGVRIFNMSLNLFDAVEENTYGIVASLLDQIADEHRVIFVMSAGNLEANDLRDAWPADPQAALQYLAGRTSPDTVLQPSESSRSIAVGAVNPPSCSPSIEGAPAAYTRRGPGLKVGVKPDLAHFGGAAHVQAGTSGLHSMAPDQSLCCGTGTSYATPLVAKTIATLESRVDGQLTPEQLISLVIHGSKVPSCLSHPTLAEVARQFVGFGVPSGSDNALFTNNNSITLVFADTLRQNSKLSFDFVWPRCLVNAEDGSCRGDIKMTLVYRPPLDRNFGSEFVRANVDAFLRQEEGTTYRGRVQQTFLPQKNAGFPHEHELIVNGLKWWPSKIYAAHFSQGKGNSSNWRLVVESLLRAGEIFPTQGIPFAVVLSISGTENDQSVFTDMRMYLLARNVQIADIRATTQVRVQS
jgi:hypothetical protein